MKNIKLILLILVAIALAGASIFYIVSDLREVNLEEKVSLVAGENEDNLPYDVDIVPIDNAKVPVPDLSREVNFINAGTKEKENIKNVSAALKLNPNKFVLWIDLSSLRKGIKDYEGALIVLEYLTKVAPENSIIYRNLADLHAFYLKDNVQAEKNIIIAIKKDPEQIEYYFKAVEIYHDIMNNVTKARAIVEEGIRSNPSSLELKQLAQSLK